MLITKKLNYKKVMRNDVLNKKCFMNYTISKSQVLAFNSVFKDAYESMCSICGDVPFEKFSKKKHFLLLLISSGISHNINWDFLCKSFMPRLILETNDLSINSLKNVTSETILRCCEGYEKKEKYDTKRRSKMLRLIAEDLSSEGGDKFIDDVLSAKTIYGTKGCIKKLEKIKVFSEDPLRKKLNLFLQLLLRVKLLNVSDEHKIEAVIDYHIIRIYLRTGRLTVTNKKLKEKLLKKVEFSPDELTELRREINKTMKYICRTFRISMAALCFTDWAIGRTYCHYDNPECTSEVNNRKCPYSAICKSCNASSEKLYREPVSDSGFY